MNRAAVLLCALALAAALPACTKEEEAPSDTGVCWHRAELADGKAKYNKVATGVDSIEKCAAALEAMRLRFLALGGTREDIVGAYQGRFLFLGRTGVFTSEKLNGARYLLLVPTGDGRLARPGAVPDQQ